MRTLPLLLALPLSACAVSGRGVDINGPLLGGTSLDGAQLAAVSLDGAVTAGNTPLRDLLLSGTELKGGGGDAFAVAGTQLYGETTDRGAVRLRIDAVAQAEDPRPETEKNELEGILVYGVSYQRGTYVGEGAARHFEAAASAEWKPLCADGARALPLSGRWDYGKGHPGDGRRLSSGDREITFACPKGALYKCVRLGYRPWEGAASLALHESCVRAVRADYCGLGISMTEEGTEVNYYDAKGLQKDEKDWPFEAAWTAAGARCVSGTRRGKAAADYVRSTCPERWRPADCGPAKGGAEGEVATEYNPRPKATP